MKIFDLLAEALKPSQYRSLVKSWDKSRYADIFSKYPHDRQSFRIYIPLKTNPLPQSEIERLISRKISSKGYTINDYKKGMASNGKREMKIGKLIADDPQLTKQFANDPVRAAKELDLLDLIVAISRHPYDIAGMSTDRAWPSCMNLINGTNRHYIPLDIEKGTIVAYLINVADKNIKRPLARIAIKPFINELDKTEILFGIENKVYGKAPHEFLTTVADWIKHENNEKALEGIFVLHPQLYHHTDINSTPPEPVVQFSDKKVEKQHNQVINRPLSIKNIDNPSEQVQMAAVKRDGNAIKHINNPSEQVQMAAIKQNWAAIEHIESPSYELQWAAVKRDVQALRHIKNPSYELQWAAVKRDMYALRYIKKPSLKLQMAASELNGDAIYYIKPTPSSERVLMAAVKQRGTALQHINNPSEKLQWAAVKQNGLAIRYIENPSEELQMAAVKQIKGAIHHIKYPSDQVYKFANS